jgi:hypothetical protein
MLVLPLMPDEIVVEGEDGRVKEVLAWQSAPEATVICDPDGTLKLWGYRSLPARSSGCRGPGAIPNTNPMTIRRSSWRSCSRE